MGEEKVSPDEPAFVKNKDGQLTKKRRLSTISNDSISEGVIPKKLRKEDEPPWTGDDDYTLKIKVKKYGQNWAKIATYFPGRTSLECFNRWFEAHQPKKGQWTKEEDAQLLKRVKSFPTKSWGEVAAGIVGRTAKQCRERWCYNLDPNINKSIWTPEEDQAIIQTQALKGNRWAYIASLLPGRTENAVKTRFKSILRAKRREWSPEEDALILKLQQEVGCQWELIAKSIPNRTKNAVKIRFRALAKGVKQQSPKLGAPNQAIHDEPFAIGKNFDEVSAPQIIPAKMATPPLKPVQSSLTAGSISAPQILDQVQLFNQALLAQAIVAQLNLPLAVNSNVAFLVQNQLKQVANLQNNLLANPVTANLLLNSILPQAQAQTANQVNTATFLASLPGAIINSQKAPVMVKEHSS